MRLQVFLTPAWHMCHGETEKTAREAASTAVYRGTPWTALLGTQGSALALAEVSYCDPEKKGKWNDDHSEVVIPWHAISLVEVVE